MIARALLLAATAVCCVTAGCENSLLDRSLVFFTNTTIGLEVSVSPSDATAPVKLIIGYKRAEGVLNPVYHSQGVEAPVTSDEAEALTGGSSYTDKDASKSGSSSYSKRWSKRVPIAGGPKTIRRYRTEAYSVIAKIAGEVQGKAGGSADGKLSVAQWFATGEAAKILARQPGIAGAVTGSSEVAKAAAQQTQFAAGLEGLDRANAMILLNHVYLSLDELATKRQDKRAEQLVERLNQLATTLVPGIYLMYDFDGTTLREDGDTVGGNVPGLVAFESGLEASLKHLGRALSTGQFQFQKLNVASAVAVQRGQPPYAEVEQIHDRQQAQLDSVRRAIASDDSVVDAIRYYMDLLTRGSTGE